MCRTACLLVLLTGVATAAPVPKEKPDPLPDGALVRLGSARFRGRNTDGVTFSKDGKTLYATDDRATVFRWDAESGKPLEPIKLDVKDAGSSRVRGDRAFVACPDDPAKPFDSCTVHVFDLPGGKVRSTFEVGRRVDFTVIAHSIHDTAISADGSRFAFGGQKGGPTVFDAGTGKAVELPADTPPGHTQLSADGRYLLIGATVVDIPAKKLLATIPAGLDLADFSPDGKWLLGRRWVRVEEKGKPARVEGRLGLWDVAAGKELPTPVVDGHVWHLGFVSAEAVVIGHLSPTDGAVLTRWDAKAGKKEWTTPVGFWAPQRFGHMLAVSPDGSRVVVTDRDGRMGLFDAATGKRLGDDPAHPGPVRWAAVSADGKTVTTANDSEFREWDATTGEPRATVRPDDLRGAVFAGATKGPLVWLRRDFEKKESELIGWDRATGKVAWRTKTAMQQVARVQTTADAVVAFGGKAPGPTNEVEVFDTEGKPTSNWETGRKDITYNPSGVGGGGVFVGELNGPTIVRWALKDGEVAAACPVPQSIRDRHLGLVAPSADAKTLTLGSRGGAWAVVEVQSGEVLHEGKAGTWIVESVATTADGKKLLVQTMHDPVVRAFELKENGKSWTLDGKGAAASAVAFSPDGKKAIVGYRDGTALIWDVSK